MQLQTSSLKAFGIQRLSSAQSLANRNEAALTCAGAGGEVFESVGAPALRNTLDGFNGTIFAYGQTHLPLPTPF